MHASRTLPRRPDEMRSISCESERSELSDRLGLEAEGFERLLRRLLLGRLLGGAAADAELVAVDERGAGETALVGRPLDLDDLVLDGPAVARKRLLQLGLVVDEARQRVVDAVGERRDHGFLDLLEPVLEEQRPESRLQQ